ncbi:hypothetical protein ACYSNM_12770 [Myroides sp. LJL116]
MYYTRTTTEILKGLFAKYNFSKAKEGHNEFNNYFVKSINSIALYAIKEGTVHLQESLLEEYFKLFREQSKAKQSKANYLIAL